MPREGLLEVDFRTAQLVADTRVPVLDEQFDNLHGPTLAATADVTDAFRSTFCQVPPPSLHPIVARSLLAVRTVVSFTSQSILCTTFLGAFSGVD